MPAPADRVLFVALDAADPDVLLAGARDGTFPALGALLARGSRVRTENPLALYVGAVWPSFWTSVGAARHGRYCFVQLEAGTYRVVETQSDDVVGTPFWRPACDAGRRVAVVDVPKCAPDASIRGLHVTDWGTHDPDHCGLRVRPAEREAEVRAALGPSPLPTCDEKWVGAAQWTRLRETLTARAERRTEFVTTLLDDDYDALLVGFPESHCIGHQAWHLHQTDHDRHDPALRAATGDLVVDVYRALDRCVGRLVEAAGPRCRVMVLASHGMGPHYDGGAALDALLERLERLLPRGRRPRLVGRLGRWLDTPTTRRWRKSLRKRTGFAPRVPSRNGGRTCFTVPNNDAWAGIRVNVVGREPHGRIRPGAELDAYVEALVARLGEVRHGDTGEPVFERILRTDAVHRGPETAAFPDVVAEWRRTRPIPALTHPAAGTVRHPYHKIRSGDHRDYGMAIAAGPGIGAGPLDASVRIEDLGPTLCAWLGVDVPGVDGRPIDAWCAPRPASSRP